MDKLLEAIERLAERVTELERRFECCCPSCNGHGGVMDGDGHGIWIDCGPCGGSGIRPR